MWNTDVLYFPWSTTYIEYPENYPEIIAAKVFEVWGKYLAMVGSLVHSDHGVLSYLVLYVCLSVHLPICPCPSRLNTALQLTIFNQFCSYWNSHWLNKEHEPDRLKCVANGWLLPRPIPAVGYCRALHHLFVLLPHPCYRSTAHNI